MKMNYKSGHDIFCDTSFLLAYYFAFYEMHATNRGETRELIFPIKFFPHYKQIEKTIPLAEIMFSYENTLSLVYDFGVLSVIEKLSENNLRNIISSHVPLLLIQNKSRKNYGALAKWLLEDSKRMEQVHMTDPSPLQHLVYNCFEATEYDFLETALWGIDFMPILPAHDLSTRISQLINFARCQIGFPDIHHLLTAQALGCKYFFSYDSDFDLMRVEIKENFNLTVITNPEQALKIITS